MDEWMDRWLNEWSYKHTQDECSQEERFSVCAINGETYVSKCHAEGAGMAVDYIRECRDVPAGQCKYYKHTYI